MLLLPCLGRILQFYLEYGIERMKTMAEIYKETFKSNFAQTTRDDALVVLDKIRREHPQSSGWQEIEAYVEQSPEGLWRAVRKHVKYTV